MRISLRNRKRTLLLKRARERHEAALVGRFFGGDSSSFQWAEPPTEDKQVLSPTWRLWITSWSAIQRLATEFQAKRSIVVLFGSMSEIGQVIVSGGTLCSHLAEWIREDADLIRISGSTGRWEVWLDVYKGDAPRVVLLAKGECWVNFAALGPGTEAWRWDFLPEVLNTIVTDLKHLVLADMAVDRSRLQELLEIHGLGFGEITGQVSSEPTTLRIRVDPNPAACRSFDGLRRALAEEVPELVVLKESQC